jgi:hypothetical protein
MCTFSHSETVVNRTGNSSHLIIYCISIQLYLVYIPPNKNVFSATWSVMSNKLAHTGRKRRYNSEPKTSSVVETSRVFVTEHAYRKDVDKDPTKKDQSRCGGVFKFVAYPEKICCKRKCLSYFLEDDPVVHAARSPLYDRNISLIVKRER